MQCSTRAARASLFYADGEHREHVHCKAQGRLCVVALTFGSPPEPVLDHSSTGMATLGKRQRNVRGQVLIGTGLWHDMVWTH